MKRQMIDSLDKDGAREFTGCKVIDESGAPIGTVDGFWMDPSTHRVAFLGVKTSRLSGNVHVVPARDALLTEQDNLVKLEYPMAFIKKAPTFSFESGLAQVEKARSMHTLGGLHHFAGPAQSRKYDRRKPTILKIQAKNPGHRINRSDPWKTDSISHAATRLFSTRKGLLLIRCPRWMPRKSCCERRKKPKFGIAKIRSRGVHRTKLCAQKKRWKAVAKRSTNETRLLPRRLNLCARTSMAHVAGLNGMKIRRN